MDESEADVSLDQAIRTKGFRSGMIGPPDLKARLGFK
jgi:hypothetical protein